LGNIKEYEKGVQIAEVSNRKGRRVQIAKVPKVPNRNGQDGVK
jgi:hypothetical protein